MENRNREESVCGCMERCVYARAYNIIWNTRNRREEREQESRRERLYLITLETGRDVNSKQTVDYKGE